MHRASGVLLAVLLVGGAVPVRAQDAGPRLTLAEAIRLALERNPEVVLALEQLEEVRGKVQEVRADAFPQVTLDGFGLRLRDPSILNSSSFDRVPPEFREALTPRPMNLFDAGIGLKQPLYTAGKVGNAIKLAKAGEKEKSALVEASRQRVAFRVFQAFHDLLLAQENLTVITETAEQRRRHLELARSRFKLGVATEIDVLRSEVNLANTEPEAIRADNRVRMARSTLNNLIVVDLDAPTQVAGRLEYNAIPEPALADLQAHALEVRPEIVAARYVVDEMRLLVALAEADNKLSVDLDTRFGYSVRRWRDYFDNDFSRWTVAFNFKLPFYDGGRKAGRIVQARSRLRSSEQSLAQLENNVKLEVKAARDDLEASARAFSAATLNVAQAQKVLEMMQANYRYGAATTLDVVDSQTALTVARNSRINAIYEYEVAKARLRLASGNAIIDQEVRRP